MKRVIALAGVAICLNVLAFGQLGLNLKTGLTVLRFTDELDISDEIRYYGHTYGFDAIVDESAFIFIAGMHYQRIAVIGTETSDPFERRSNFHQIHVPINIGVQLTGDRFLRLRPYAGVHFNFVIAMDENSSDLTVDRVSGFNPGAQIGFQFSLYPFTFDIQGIFGGRRFVLSREDSKFRGIIFLAGIMI